MAKAARTTQSGFTITAEVLRDVQDKRLWADGWDIPAGREIVSLRQVTMTAPDGRIVARAQGIEALRPDLYAKDAEMATRGDIVGKLGNVYLTQATEDLITSALAEAEAAAPGCEEFWALKEAQDAARRRAELRAEREAPMLRAHEAFTRRMEAADSDL